MLNGLSLFTGIGGIDLALSKWVRPVAYCEIDTYAAGVLFSRMSDGSIPTAPIWPDIRRLTAKVLPPIDIVSGGFPCQDISYAGAGKGLAGERSGLFFEIVRLLREIRPRVCYLENVPAITTRGGWRVVGELAALGYDCRWGVLSAYDMGAPHYRERFWLLANADSSRRSELYESKQISLSGRKGAPDIIYNGAQGFMANVANSQRNRLEESRDAGISGGSAGATTDSGWWATEPAVGRVVNGLRNRVDRIKCLGNAVVPCCAEGAFKRLIGL